MQRFFRRPRPLLLLIGQTILLAAARPMLAQEAPAKPALPPLEDRFVLRKEQWSMADEPWLERDAISGKASIVQVLANVAYLANTINGDPASQTYGWQSSKIYRSDHGGNNPANARIMEPVSTLAWAYTLNKPWNPYYHDAVLGARLSAALDYWLHLMAPGGGFPEDNGRGTRSLPGTSFCLEFLVDMSEMLDADGTLDKDLRARLFAAVKESTLWIGHDRSAIEAGYHYSNQYTGSLYTMWRLWERTQDPQWKELYDTRLEAWITNAQPCYYWLEANGVETFGYSHVTEWELDRIYARNRDPRILETFRKYFEWGNLNTVVENDGETLIMDQVGHGRTSRGPSGSVGYYNHIASELPNARPFVFSLLMTPAEREARVANWLQNPTLADAKQPGLVPTYHPFHAWPMDFEPHGQWTVTREEHDAAVREMPCLARQRFTRYFSVPAGKDEFLFARRLGVYATLHWGKPDKKQAKELGLVWLPGFGTVLRGYNDNQDLAFCTRMGDKSTFKRAIEDFPVPASFRKAGADGNVEAGDLEFSTNFGGLGIRKTYRITDDGLEIITHPQTAATEQIPLYFDSTDTVTLDGRPLDIASTNPVSIEGKTLSIRRTCGGKTAIAAVEFGSGAKGTMKRGYDLARGGVYIFSLNIPADTDFHTRIQKG